MNLLMTFESRKHNYFRHISIAGAGVFMAETTQSLGFLLKASAWLESLECERSLQSRAEKCYTSPMFSSQEA